MMERILKAAILGMGNMGRGHASSMMKMEGVKLSALCSEPIGDARRFAEEEHLE